MDPLVRYKIHSQNLRMAKARVNKDKYDLIQLSNKKVPEKGRQEKLKLLQRKLQMIPNYPVSVVIKVKGKEVVKPGKLISADDTNKIEVLIHKRKIPVSLDINKVFLH